VHLTLCGRSLPLAAGRLITTMNLLRKYYVPVAFHIDYRPAILGRDVQTSIQLTNV
jgi:hypothetical protein